MTTALERFCNTSGKAIEGFIILPSNRDDIITAALGGNPIAGIVFQSIGRWFQDAAAANAANAPLCMNYNYPTCFTPEELPAAFAVAVPFAVAKGSALVSGICRKCADGKDSDGLLAIARQSWRKIWPDMQVAESGTS
jgi:hypothetical protein